MQQATKPLQPTRTYTAITAQKPLISSSQQHCLDELKKALASYQKTENEKSTQMEGATKKTGESPIQPKVLMEKLELVLKVNKVVSIGYDFSRDTVIGIYSVTAVGDVGPIELLILNKFEEDRTKYLKEGNTVTLTNLKLVLDRNICLISSHETVLLLSNML